MTHHLGRRGVLFGTQLFEQGFLARINQDRQSCGANFYGQGPLVFSDTSMCMRL
jgi:hypothetical protein